MNTIQTKVEKIYIKVKQKLSNIDSDSDLKKQHLTLAEYNILVRILNKAFRYPTEEVYCISSSVAEWCRKAGLQVVPPHEGNTYTCVNYTISVV